MVKMGKDTVFVWEDGVFQIGHYSTGNHLEFHENGNNHDDIGKCRFL